MKKKENKTMKKVLTVSALALLLGLVGYTGGSTFAKYISEMENQSATATVAQWGYTLNANAKDLFGNVYENASSTVATVNDDATANIVVKGLSGDKVAPGTTGSATFSVQGQAEVLSRLEVVSSISDVSLSDGSKTYSPIKWSVTGDAVIGSTNHLPADIVDGSAAQVEEFLDGLTTNVIPVNTEINIDVTITWEWAFDGVASTELANLFTSDPDDKLTGNQADTVLANGGKHYNGNGTEELSGEYTLVTSTSFSLDARVEQLAHE